MCFTATRDGLDSDWCVIIAVVCVGGEVYVCMYMYIYIYMYACMYVCMSL